MISPARFLNCLITASLSIGCVIHYLSDKSVVSFDAAPAPAHRDSHISYDLNLRREKFYVWLPPNFSASDPYGLIVYISPDDDARIPDGWAGVLAEQKFLFIAPLNAGNNQLVDRRTGLGVLAASAMMKNYRIDINRVFVAGLSGGARTASALGFWQPDVFRGTIQDCGTNFYRAVSSQYNANLADLSGVAYGILPSTSLVQCKTVRSTVKFVLITGSGDFRHTNILDIYNNGFRADGFQSLLVDVSQMGHQDCDGQTLLKALMFLCGGE